MGEMDTDLMRSPGFELAGEEARHRLAVGTWEGLKLLPMGHGFAAVGPHRHLVARMRVPADRLVDGAAGPIGGAPHKGKIAAPHRAGAAVVGELPRQ